MLVPCELSRRRGLCLCPDAIRIPERQAASGGAGVAGYRLGQDLSLPPLPLQDRRGGPTHGLRKSIAVASPRHPSRVCNRPPSSTPPRTLSLSPVSLVAIVFPTTFTPPCCLALSLSLLSLLAHARLCE